MPENFKEKLAKALAAAGLENAQALLETPTKRELGDFALPCFKLSAQMKKAPQQIALDLKAKIKLPKDFSRVEASGPYLNFFLDEQMLASDAFEQLLSGKKTKIKKAKEKIVVEYCQANPMKAFHIGHVRNIVMGEAIARLLESQGANVIRIDYGGDVGPHVSKTLYAYQNLEHPQEPKDLIEKEKWLGNLYSAGSKAVKENAQLEEKMREMVVQLEQGDAKLKKDWTHLRKASIECFMRIFEQLGTKFDRIILESEVEKEGIKIANALHKYGFAKKDQGALLVDLEEYELGKFLILKTDGAALYSSKDLALAKLKKKELKATKSYNVVGAEQSFYFRQLIKTLELLNATKDEYCKTEHISYELVRLEGGKMSSREGNVITYTELFDEMLAKTMAETKSRHEDWPQEKVEKTAQTLALAAIKFGMLNHDRNKVISFNWERATSLEGETGPFLIYSYARANSVLRKAGKISVPKKMELSDESEKTLAHALSEHSAAISQAAADLSPQKACIFAMNLAQIFNSFYQKVPILQSEGAARQTRLALCAATARALAQTLQVLNIPFVEEM